MKFATEQNGGSIAPAEVKAEFTGKMYTQLSYDLEGFKITMHACAHPRFMKTLRRTWKEQNHTVKETTDEQGNYLGTLLVMREHYDIAV